MSERVVEAEVIDERIVACPKCGRRNRLYKRTASGVYKCGACRAALVNPFGAHGLRMPSMRNAGIIGASIFALLVIIVIVATNQSTPRTPAQQGEIRRAAERDSRVDKLISESGPAALPPIPKPDYYNSSPSAAVPPAASSAADTTLRRAADGTYYLPPSALTENAKQAIAALKQRGVAVNAESVAAEIARADAHARPSMPLPESGESLTSTDLDPVAPFEIKSSRGGNYLVKLADAESNQTVMTIFVRGGETVKVDVPLGTFVVKYAFGDAWYGYDDLFGPKTAYSKATTTFTFQSTATHVRGYTITLYKVLNGNLETRSIKASEF